MTLEQLQAMSDKELDKLAAIKFLWGGMVNVPSDDWRPTTDMNDAFKLQNALNEEELHSYTLRLMKMVSSFGNITYGDVTNILKSSARDRTIAALLSKN